MTWRVDLLVRHVVQSWTVDAMVTFWMGDTNYWPAGQSGTPESDTLKGISLNIPRLGNGDTIDRILFEWVLFTDLHENSLITDGLPVPWAVGVWYEPNPDQFFEFDSVNAFQTLQGDGLYQAITEWKPYHWTDGTIHSTQWHASSGGVQSLKGERTIVDKTSAALRVQVLPLSDLGLSTLGNVIVNVGGWYNMKILINR